MTHLGHVRDSGRDRGALLSAENLEEVLEVLGRGFRLDDLLAGLPCRTRRPPPLRRSQLEPELIRRDLFQRSEK